MKLTEIDGVSSAKAERLEEHGWKTAEGVATANLALITQVEGVGPDIVINAIHQIGYDRRAMNERHVDYRCSHCGQSRFKTVFAVQDHEEKCDDNPSNGQIKRDKVTLN